MQFFLVHHTTVQNKLVAYIWDAVGKKTQRISRDDVGVHCVHFALP